jgi:hypothetical protein
MDNVFEVGLLANDQQSFVRYLSATRTLRTAHSSYTFHRLECIVYEQSSCHLVV